MKKRFDEEGISIPFPQRDVQVCEEKVVRQEKALPEGEDGGQPPDSISTPGTTAPPSKRGSELPWGRILPFCTGFANMRVDHGATF